MTLTTEVNICFLVGYYVFEVKYTFAGPDITERFTLRITT